MRNSAPKVGHRFSYFMAGPMRLADGRASLTCFRQTAGEPSSPICGARVRRGFYLRTLHDSQPVSHLRRMQSTLPMLCTLIALR